MGGEAQTHRTDPGTAGGCVRRDGSRGEGRRHHCWHLLAEEDASSGQLERGSESVRVSHLLY